jgi:predicted alpha/beta-hydrolase family hydrolase
MKPKQFINASSGDVPVRGFMHRPETPPIVGLVLTHGAGSNCNSPLLVSLAEAFREAGWAVLRCDLPFRQRRANGPPPRGGAERDQAGLRAAVTAMRREVSAPVYLSGHSYGGRQASMLAASDPAVTEALLLLSYPLHPPQRADALRTAHLPNLRTPTFFVHGTKDGFGSIAEMESAIRLIPAYTSLFVVSGAGHGLMTRGNRGTLAALIAGSFITFAAT